MPRIFDFAGLAGKRVLEIGVGNGIDAVEMVRAGAIYAGIDVTERHLELTRRNFCTQGMAEPRLWHGDLLDVNIGEKFDCVYSFGVLHHIEHESEYLGRLRDLIEAGGSLRIGLYSKYSLFNAYLLLGWFLRTRTKVPLDDWRSHVAEMSSLGSPVPIKIRSKAEIKALLAKYGFRITQYWKRGFVQGYVPGLGQHLASDGRVLNAFGSVLGWYHLMHCEPLTDAKMSDN